MEFETRNPQFDYFESHDGVLTKNLLAAAERDSDFGHTQKRANEIKLDLKNGRASRHSFCRFCF